MIDSTYEDKLYQTPTFAGAVRKLQTNELRNTVMLRLLRVNRLCSRTVSGTANRLKKHGRRNPLPFPFFAAVTCRQSAPDYPRERGDSQEGGNRRCLPSLRPRGVSALPAAGRGELPRSAERSFPLDFRQNPTVHNQKPVLYKTQRS